MPYSLVPLNYKFKTSKNVGLSIVNLITGKRAYALIDVLS